MTNALTALSPPLTFGYKPYYLTPRRRLLPPANQGDLRFVRQVEQYLKSIDDRRLVKALSIFAPSAVYDREGWPRLSGLRSIIDFYRFKRSLRGQHLVSSAQFKTGVKPDWVTGQRIPKGRMVCIEGQFQGTHQGQAVDLSFKDFWVFRASDGKALYRRSWISAPGM